MPDFEHPLAVAWRAGETVAHLIRNAVLPIALRLDLLERNAPPQRAGENLRQIRQHVDDLQRLAAALERSTVDSVDAEVAAAPLTRPESDRAQPATHADLQRDTRVPISVLCFDDNVMLTEALGMRLSLEPDIAWLDPHHTLTGAASVIATLQPTVVLLDLNIPGDLSALDLVQALHQSHCESRVVVLTGNPTAATLSAVTSAGVHGFLGKGAAPAVLIDTLRRVAGGETVITAMS